MLIPRSGQERGLHERAARAGVSLPCPISWITVPLKRAHDDDTLELTKWPILLPYDFVSHCEWYFSWRFLILVHHKSFQFLEPLPSGHQPLGSQASTLISEGYLGSLVADRAKLLPYWRGMIKDFPEHPVQESDPGLSSSIGCTLYGVWDSI